MNTSEKERIGVLGGSFDPIHNGHKALGEAAIEEGKLAKLIVMPANVQPFKQGNPITASNHRKTMVELAFSGNDKVIVSDYELKNTILSYTYDTMVYLRKLYPESLLYFVLGTDSFLSIENWYKGVDLLKNFNFIVSERPGYKERELDSAIEKFTKEYDTEIIKIYKKMPNISSTALREEISSGKCVSHLIPEAVERYINDNDLYR
jgi:nicotinate-nucleotide adenylyltransferase